MRVGIDVVPGAAAGTASYRAYSGVSAGAPGAASGRAIADGDVETRPNTWVYSIPMRTRFRGIDVREGMLIRGPVGWGEFCPFTEYSDTESAAWLATAVEQAFEGWPA